MSKAKNLLEAISGLTYSESPFKYQHDYKFRTEIPTKQVDVSSLPAPILKLFHKYTPATVNFTEFYTLTSSRPDNIRKLRELGILMGKNKAGECYRFESDLFFTDGKVIYTPSERSLIYLYFCK